MKGVVHVNTAPTEGHHLAAELVVEARCLGRRHHPVRRRHRRLGPGSARLRSCHCHRAHRRRHRLQWVLRRLARQVWLHQQLSRTVNARTHIGRWCRSDGGDASLSSATHSWLPSSCSTHAKPGEQPMPFSEQSLTCPLGNVSPAHPNNSALSVSSLSGHHFDNILKSPNRVTGLLASKRRRSQTMETR